MTAAPGRADADPALATFERYESAVRSYSRSYPVVFTQARGARLLTRGGRCYIDFLAGCSSLNYGHNPPALKQALLDYIAADGIAHSLDLFTAPREAFLQALHEVILAPRGLDYVVQFPGPTGTNAIEAAIKLARKVTRRHNVICFTNAFHGVTLGALAFTGNRLHRLGAGRPLGAVTRMPYDGYFGEGIDTASYLEHVLGDPSSGIDPPAAILLETVQGEGGLNVASHAWLQRVAMLARTHGALLIIDDIQAGVGRTGSFFSFEPAGIRPNIVVLAKSVSGYGLPMALVLIERSLDQWLPGEHNGTFRGNCHAFVTAAAALTQFWRAAQFEAALAARSKLLQALLDEIVQRHRHRGIRLKGRGLMQGIDMKSGTLASDVVRAAFDLGLIVEAAGPHDEVIKCLPPLTIADGELTAGLELLGHAVDRVLARNATTAL